jgi:hypothetical protein
VVGLAHLILKAASPHYRKFLAGAIIAGLKAAESDYYGCPCATCDGADAGAPTP